MTVLEHVTDFVNEEIHKDISKIKIKGVGPKLLGKLQLLGISKVIDLLYYFPRDYEDRTNIKNIKDIVNDEVTVAKGKVIKCSSMRSRRNMSIFKAWISDGTATMEITWFQMPYLSSSITMGRNISVYGKVQTGFGYKMTNPEYSILDEATDVEERILPIYPLTSGLNQNTLRKVIAEVLEQYKDILPEVIPAEIASKYSIMPRNEAIVKIHFPKNSKELEETKRRFAIEELLILQFGILSKRFESELNNEKKYALAADDKKELVRKFLALLNFDLTKAQKRVITEIYNDIKKGKVVNRLLQGDVGSGKTIVAFIMLLYMVENGYQTAIMAPTEILAEQHYLSMKDNLEAIGVRIALLTSSTKMSVKLDILSKIYKGEIDIIIGTHALIYDNVVFKNLGMIVIDEQHKFGVLQRKKLRDKGLATNLIVMSATPIPRSLALTIYGDLDVSVIDELPPGRRAIATKCILGDKNLEELYLFIRQKVLEGRQCYVVCPLIEESEKMDLNAAEKIYEDFRSSVFPEQTVAMLHGRMSGKDKEAIMREFKDKNIDILVATTVIEVGVDVANATVMVILDAHRYGLAQLHQIRGRVGRGSESSHCFLVTDFDNFTQRLKIMEQTNDGFKIAEEDLLIRKPGEILGTKQSGLSDMRFIHILRDIKTIKLARDETIDYLTRNKGIIKHEPLRKAVQVKFEQYEYS